MTKYLSPDTVRTTFSNMTLAWTEQQGNVTAPKGCVILNKASGGFIPWDNPDNIISQETEQIVGTAVGVACLPILLFISTPSNILNMLVFYKQGLKERINLCLFFLSLVDCLHMLNNFFFNVDRLYLQFTKAAQFGPVLEFIINHKLVGFRGFNWLSGFTSMLIACERCLCVVSPLHSQTVLKTQTTAVILMAATLFILTGSMLIGVRLSIACVFNPVTNSTSKVIYTSEFYAQNKAHMDALTLFVGTIQPFIFVTVTAATTIVTSVKLKKMVAWREQTTSSMMSSREVALIRTLIAVSFLYVICSLPAMMVGVGLMFVPNMSLSGRYHNLTNLMLSVFELASFINATFNFFVYCFLGSKYRETLWAVLQCKTVATVAAR